VIETICEAEDVQDGEHQISRLGDRINPVFPCRFAVSDAATSATAETTA
jgi:hypothetical protein